MRGFFNVDTWTDGTPHDVRYALVADTSLSGSQRNAVVNALDASSATLSPTVTHEPDLDVRFFDRFDATNTDKSHWKEVDDAQKEVRKDFEGSPSLNEALPADRTVRGRIQNAAALPPLKRRFTGETTEIAQISYQGPTTTVGTADVDANDPGREQFAFQFHDGFMYSFPRDVPYYTRDARYDVGRVNSDQPTVEAVEGGRRSFTVPLPLAVDRSGSAKLVPSFTHRAHPSLAALRSIATRRAILLGIAGGTLHEELTPLKEYLSRLRADTENALLSVIGTLGPAHTKPTPTNVARAAFLGLAPVGYTAGMALVAPPLVAVTAVIAEIALAAFAIAAAVKALLQWGETIQDVFKTFGAALVEDLFYDPGCGNDNVEEDDARRESDEGPQCNFPDAASPAPNESTPFAVGELSRFLGYFGPAALARGTQADSPLISNLTTYRSITGEIAEQASLFRTTLDKAASLDQEVRETFRPILAKIMPGGTLAKSEQALLNRVETDFQRPLWLPGFATLPRDPDGDGRYEDVNGDGVVDVADVQALFAHRNSDVVQNHARAFNFSDSDPGSVTRADVRALFDQM